jgi:hypothetical protein
MKKFRSGFAGLLLVGVCSVALAGANADKPVGNMGNPGILPPQSMPYGKSYGEWGSAWWQWILAIPASASPLIDDTGANAANGQSGKVWFLAGTWGSQAPVRHVTIPRGKALFFPVVNVECSSLECQPGNDYCAKNEAELKACVNAHYQPPFPVMWARVDGVPVKNLDQYLATSPEVFSFTVPETDPLPGYDSGTGISLAAGHWLMLAPLSAGAHTIEFYGADPLNSPPAWWFQVTYILTVK